MFLRNGLRHGLSALRAATAASVELPTSDVLRAAGGVPSRTGGARTSGVGIAHPASRTAGFHTFASGSLSGPGPGPSANPWDTERRGPQTEADWKRLVETGADVNPCASPFHPAVEQGIEPEGNPISVQEAYSPSGICFGCGVTNSDGLHLKSFREGNGLVAEYIVDDKYQAFPGIVNGGIVGTLMDCHGNWTAAIALMDRGGLPRPPLTLTSSYTVKLLHPTPPGELIRIRSQVIRLKEQTDIGNTMAKVEVEVKLSTKGAGGAETVNAVANFLFHKVGALRSL